MKSALLHRTKIFRIVGYVFVVLLLISIGLALAMRLGGLTINITPSMPRGIWYKTAGDASHYQIGDVVLACLPPTKDVLEAKRRGYLKGGSCRGEIFPLLKVIAAKEGDEIYEDQWGVVVNGRKILNSQVMSKDRRGRALKAYHEGFWRVPPASYVLLSTYSPYSYDSRYFGPLAQSALGGTLRPLWVEKSRPWALTYQAKDQEVPNSGHGHL